MQDTLQANRERCVGMAANMISVKKNIIIVNMGVIDIVMFNPVIISKISTGKNNARNCPDGRHRLPSTKWIIYQERLYDIEYI